MTNRIENIGRAMALAIFGYSLLSLLLQIEPDRVRIMGDDVSPFAYRVDRPARGVADPGHTNGSGTACTTAVPVSGTGVTPGSMATVYVPCTVSTFTAPVVRYK